MKNPTISSNHLSIFPPSVPPARRRVSLSVSEPHMALPALLARLESLNCRLTGLTTRHASLEDVFVKLAGRHLSEADAPTTEKAK